MRISGRWARAIRASPRMRTASCPHGCGRPTARGFSGPIPPALDVFGLRDDAQLSEKIFGPADPQRRQIAQLTQAASIPMARCAWSGCAALAPRPACSRPAAARASIFPTAATACSSFRPCGRAQRKMAQEPAVVTPTEVRKRSCQSADCTGTHRRPLPITRPRRSRTKRRPSSRCSTRSRKTMQPTCGGKRHNAQARPNPICLTCCSSSRRMSNPRMRRRHPLSKPPRARTCACHGQRGRRSADERAPPSAALHVADRPRRSLLDRLR